MAPIKVFVEQQLQPYQCRCRQPKHTVEQADTESVKTAARTNSTHFFIFSSDKSFS